MKYGLCYAFYSMNGMVRGNNEDNIYIDGFHLEEEHVDTEDVMSGTVTGPAGTEIVCGVFDGMGGEAAGETAAYLAAKHMGMFVRDLQADPASAEEKTSGERTQSLAERLCREMNREVCRYASSRRIRSMGTTAAYLVAGAERISLANIGDSRIYRMRHGQLSQVSKDHLWSGFLGGKGQLTQFLGIPEDEMMVQPHVVTEDCERGTIYLLCTDGVTDMVSDKTMEDIMRTHDAPRGIVRALCSAVMENGAQDNATMLVVKIS